MNLDDAIQTFIVEADELLQNMEESLLRLEQTPLDSDCINQVFRAAHTIKGSAGLFGLDYLVEFTHVVESVLDKVRSSEIMLDEKLSALLLEVCDHLRSLLKYVINNSEPDQNSNNESASLVDRLNVYLNFSEESSPKDNITNNNVSITTSNEDAFILENENHALTDNWHISIRFGREVFKNGMDPFGFIRYLSTIGSILHLETITTNLPSLEDIDPEECYLGFEISFKSTKDIHAIEEVFEFIKDSSTIHIIPPHSKISEFINVIEHLPETEMKLGEILVKCGTLTANELEYILEEQSNKSRSPKKLLGELLVDANLAQPAVVEAALEKQKIVKDNKISDANLIRVDANKLDQLINMVGELIIVTSAAKAIAEKSGLPAMLENTNNISSLVESVRDTALGLRMVQIGPTFKRFQRIVRDISKELGKDIRLEISGEETELDKTVVEKIADPLTHLVRNAMDHGIEPLALREEKGKSAFGTVKLKAYHDAGNIMIEVSDDGSGLNRDKIVSKAIERGIIVQDQLLSDSEIYNLIFEPGFSTADSVSNISGRGVGMDVVKRNIQDLRGVINISSIPSMGTTISIRLPLTLAIIDGFLVEVGSSTYVIPLDAVIECVEMNVSDNDLRDIGYLNLRGEVLPYQRLREHFEIQGDISKRENVVVVQYGSMKVGLVVDKLLGEFQTVIKPLGKVFNQISGIGGFTILGNGDVALILDIPGLINQLNNKETNSTAMEKTESLKELN